jgi:GntR family transcriptional regulator, arabinose operon transcriptional repressor
MDTDGPKYRQIWNSLKTAIESGAYAPGVRLPSEFELVQSYGASRVTVSRALKELQNGGYIDRRAGSGTYVRVSGATPYTFGLLIPELGQTEIFEPICQGMVAAQRQHNHVLIWGPSLASSDVTVAKAKEACARLIANRVSGVFFAPIEATPLKNEVNLAIVAALKDAGVAVILLDRDIFDYPERSNFDVVGIDNRRAGCIATQHLIRAGCRRIAFVGRSHLAPSCIARSAGYRDALACSQETLGPAYIERLDPSDKSAVQQTLENYDPDGIVCSNDRTAALLMRTLTELKVALPERIRIVAFDDVKYASLVAVPLSTIHQPCDQLGAAAILAMFQRIANPEMPARDILVDFHLVVRESCGTRRTTATA